MQIRLLWIGTVWGLVAHAQPAPDVDLIRLTNGSAYVVSGGPRTPEQTAALAKLSDARRTRFDSIRRNLLTQAAMALDASHLAIGAGTIAKDRLVMVRDHLVGKAGAEAAVESSDEELKGIFKVSLSGKLVAQRFLEGINDFLMENAEVIADSKEFGGSFFGGVVGVHGAGSKTFGGAAGLNLRIGYHVADKAFVFGIEAHGEKMKRALTPTINYGLLPKVMFYAHADPKMVREALVTYPPAFPGVEAHGKGAIEAGFSPSTLTFPGSPIGDLASWQNDATHVTLLRVKASPLLPGFVRAESGGAEFLVEKGAQAATRLRPFVQSVTKARGAVMNRFERIRAASCDFLLAFLFEE